MPWDLGEHLFVHLPKTGGTWVRSSVHRPRKLGGEHGPAYEVPWLQGRTVVSHIRDPWSWYASLYLHATQHMDRAPIRAALAAWGCGSVEWDAVLYGMTHPWELEQAPETPGVLWSLYGAGPHPQIQAGDVGLWSWAYAAMLRDGPALLLDLSKAKEGWSLLGLEMDHPPANVRTTAGYRDRYTRAQREWVRSADRALIDQCGYTFLGPAKEGPLIPWRR